MIRAVALGLLLSSSCSWATEPAQVDYMLNCQGCHLPDGSGFPARQVPDLRNRMGSFLSVPGGREYLVQVPGTAQTAPPFIPTIIGVGGQDWPAVAAGATLFLIPVVVFTILLRKHLLRGITFGAVRK